MKAFLFKVLVGVAVFYVLPIASFAQSFEPGKDSAQGYILLILQFINWTIIPLLFSIALLFFLINAARYFILEGDNDDGHEKAKLLSLYGIGAFVFLVSLWGVVNMLVFGLGIGDEEALCPDYLDDWCGTSSDTGGSFYLFDDEESFYIQ